MLQSNKFLLLYEFNVPTLDASSKYYIILDYVGIFKNTYE